MGIGDVFERSWNITKLSFGVIKKDKEILMFPIIASVISLIFIVSMLIPIIIGEFFGSVIAYLMLFILYLGLAFIGTFFNIAVVNTAKKRFEGGDATFFESLGFAFSKIHLVILWSLVSATVGIILKIIYDFARSIKGIGQIIVMILQKILGLVWNIATIFVLQGIVYEGLGPFASIKRSVEILKKTWGESLIRYYGLGFVEAIFLVAGIIIGFILIIFSVISGIIILIFVSIIILIVYITLIILIFGVANTVFNTALYVYASKGKIPEGFDKETLKNSFKKQENPVSRIY